MVTLEAPSELDQLKRTVVGSSLQKRETGSSVVHNLVILRVVLFLGLFVFSHMSSTSNDRKSMALVTRDLTKQLSASANLNE